MERSILVVTVRGDVHADVVAGMLRRRGHDPLIVFPDEVCGDGTVRARYDGDRWRTGVRTGGAEADLDSVRAVWWRKPHPVRAAAWLAADEREYAEGEWDQTLRGIWAGLAVEPGVYWMSDPRRLEESSYKVEQMRRAASLGLRLPRTLVTNDPVRLRDFHADCAGEIVHKTLAAPLMGVDSGRVYALDEALPATVPGLLTRRVTAEHLAQSDRVALMPSFFQELVAKRTELRVTVFEDQIFTAVLHSQDDERTAVDWRHHEVPFRYSSGVLPDDVARKCLALMRSYELTFGTFDFIVTPEGEHVFLEMNPNGQWMFVQQRLPELTMAQTLVDILLRNAA